MNKFGSAAWRWISSATSPAANMPGTLVAVEKGGVSISRFGMLAS